MQSFSDASAMLGTKNSAAVASHNSQNTPKNYRVVKQNCQVEKIVNLGHPNDFMTQKSSLIFVKTIFG